MTAEKPTKKKEELAFQLGRLAGFIVSEFPGEPSRSEGVIDTAMRIMRTQRDLISRSPAPKVVTRERLQNMANEIGECFGPDGYELKPGKSEEVMKKILADLGIEIKEENKHGN